MTASDARRIRELEQRLSEAQAAIQALLSGQVDAVLDSSSGTPILLARAQDDLRKSADALRIAQERTRYTLHSANIGVWDWEYEANTMRWSEVLEAQYGLKPGTFGGTFDAFMACIHPEDRNAIAETIQTAVRTRTDFKLVNRAILPDGTIRLLSGAGRILLNEDGTVIGGVGISQDITEQWELERQYMQAQKMKAVGQLASGIAHDFNNLLTVILGCTEILLSGEDITDDQKPELLEIEKASRSAADLTRQLLAFGRQQVLHTAPIDVNVLVTNMTAMLVRLIGKTIEVELALASDLPQALADGGQVEQVMMNLVMNARDAMPEGGRINIRTAATHLDHTAFEGVPNFHGTYVMISVIDSGSGMTEETLRRLFEPFYTTKERGKGTGLGLSSTYGIIKQSKGFIAVESELGRGTTVKLYLPLAEDLEGVGGAGDAAGGKAGGKAGGEAGSEAVGKAGGEAGGKAGGGISPP